MRLREVVLMSSNTNACLYTFPTLFQVYITNCHVFWEPCGVSQDKIMEGAAAGLIVGHYRMA